MPAVRYKSLRGLTSALAILPALALAACATDAGAPPAALVLSGTAWQLTEIRPGNAAEPVATVAEPGRYTLRFDADGQVAALFDCNRGGGRWTSTGGIGPAGSLELSPMVSTKMFCGEASLGDRFGQALTTITSYTLHGSELVLGPTPDGGLLVMTRAGI